ncbi:MAG TPA: hypothetical protein PKZ60_04030 [Candidatus Saccharicenans sp.]|nr:hypothetical protein [Candidatus Saccharicenans sp.]
MPAISVLDSIPKVRFHEPELNLPSRLPGLLNGEEWFTIQFAQAYLGQQLAVHQRSRKDNIVCVRQVSVNGFGIADLVSVSWESRLDSNHGELVSAEEFLLNFKPTIRAFEVKLDNWRKGMIQAHRYRFFSNAAILVLPADKVSNALRYIGTFKKIHVGLWSFDPTSRKIIAYYTPRPSYSVQMKYAVKALQKMANTSKALPISQKP